jgi:hypothetical protein
MICFHQIDTGTSTVASEMPPHPPSLTYHTGDAASQFEEHKKVNNLGTLL